MLSKSVLDLAQIRVAIVDDDPLVRNGLERLIAAGEDLRCSGVFSRAEDAIEHLGTHPTDVLLLDIGLPGMDGSAAVSLLRAKFPQVVILMLTVFSDRARVFLSICNGASGYLLKSTPSHQIHEAIRSAHKGGSPLSPQVARQIVDLFQLTGPPQPAVAITSQEKALLQLLAEGHSYESAARQMMISVNTVRNYVRSVYEKLHVHSKSAAVMAALRQGLI